MLQSPTAQILVHPIVLDFLEQTLEHVKLPHEQPRRADVGTLQKYDHSADDNHLDTM